MFSCGICKTFWKHVKNYYVTKNYVGHKLASSMPSSYSIAFIANPMMRHETRVWCGVTSRRMGRQQKRVPETKRRIAHAVLFWWELIPLYQRITRIIFRVCVSSFKQKYFGNFTCRQTHFVCPKSSGEYWITPLLLHVTVLGMTWKGLLKFTSGW